MSSMTYRTSLSNTLYTYLVFGNLLWIEVDVLLRKEFVSDFGNIGILLQVKLEFMNVLPGLRYQLINDRQSGRLESQAKLYGVRSYEAASTRRHPVRLVPVSVAESCAGLHLGTQSGRRIASLGQCLRHLI